MNNIIRLDAKTLYETRTSWVLHKNLERFEHDWNLRDFIFKTSNDISQSQKDITRYYRLGTMPDYFIWLSKNMGLLKGDPSNPRYRVKQYYTDKQEIIAYSYGAESIVTDNLLPSGTPFLIIDNPQSLPHTYEGCLAIIGASLGYRTTYIGNESDIYGKKDIKLALGEPSKNHNYNHVELHDDFIPQWNSYAYPATVKSLVSKLNKLEVVNRIIELGEFNNLRSCFNWTVSEQWCGTCYKCFEMYHILNFAELYQDSCPINLTEMQNNDIKIPKFTGNKNIYIDQFKNYIETGEDPFYNLGLFSYMLEHGYDIRDTNNY